MPHPGETVTGRAFDIIPGGKGANQAVAAARAGAAVTFVSRIGNDNFGLNAVRGYEKDNINTCYISIDPAVDSGTAMIMVEDSGQNSIVVVPGANENLSPHDIDKAQDEIMEADVVLLQLEIPLTTVEYTLAIAKKYKKRTILNPAPAVRLPESILAHVDIITPNETETALLTSVLPTDDLTLQAASKILHKYVQTVIITLGERGAYFSTGDKSLIIPAQKVKPIDTTAAGDVFNGYLAAALASNLTLQDAIRRANDAAALSVLKHGAQPSIPYSQEL
jgi:ribokinase